MEQPISVNLPKLASCYVVGEDRKNTAKFIVKWVGEVSLMGAALLTQVTLQKWKCNHQDYEAGIAIGVKAVKYA